MPVTCVSSLVLVSTLVATPAAAADVTVGRIEQVDRGADVINTWLRPATGQPVLVQSPLTAPPPEIGTRVRVQGTPLEDHVQAARDGRTRAYRAVRLRGIWQEVGDAGAGWWLPAVVGGLFVLFLLVAVLTGRRRASRRPPAAPASAAAPVFEASHLPSDPALALAALARQADQEGGS
ncbi:MAG: hypothetical protein QF733_01735 [Phycisphaerales bacterium]|jgi:hypothetical protein|nr:hypothetical protein [Phycisphaerales bacterium]